MANLFKSILSLVILIAANFVQASECADYFHKSMVRIATEKLIVSHSVYSPWYYNILKEKATNEELLSAFEKTSTERLSALSQELYENLTLSGRLPDEPTLASLQVEALNKSLIAIQKTKRFPMQVEVKEVSKRGKVWMARGSTFLGGTALVMSFFMPASDFSTGLAGVGAVLTSGGVVTFLLGTEQELINQQSVADVSSFIISEGEVNSLSTAHDRFTEKKGELIESKTNYEVHQSDGRYFVRTIKPS